MNRKLIRPNLTEIKEKMNQEREREKDAVRKRMHPPTDTFAESYYYLKQMNKKTPVAVVYTDGEVVEGYIECMTATASSSTATTPRTCSSTRPASAASTRSARRPSLRESLPAGNDRSQDRPHRRRSRGRRARSRRQDPGPAGLLPPAAYVLYADPAVIETKRSASVCG